jgi:putative cell wall-binding protein/subtilisin family serine protease/uncharacterized protein YjdB
VRKKLISKIANVAFGAILVMSMIPSAPALAEESSDGGTGESASPDESMMIGEEPDQIIVSFDGSKSASGSGYSVESSYSTESLSTTLQSKGFTFEKNIGEGQDSSGNMALMNIPEGESVDSAIEIAENTPGVDYAQPNYIYHLYDDNVEDSYVPDPEAVEAAAQRAMSTDITTEGTDGVQLSGSSQLLSTTVDDPAANVSDSTQQENQYWLYNTNAFDAWDTAMCQHSVTIVVIDTGVTLDHEDLADNILTDYAYDAYYGKKLEGTGDYYGHGTHVCGIAAGVTNNAKGIAGASFNANILPIKVCNNATYNPSIDTADLVKAYNYFIGLIDDGSVTDIHVVNMSLGGYATPDSDDIALHDQIINARDNYDVITVCAGGNGDDNGMPLTIPSYPSDWDECVAVTALEADGTNAYWSDYNEYKDISAPGVSIYSTLKNSTSSYGKMSGTSMASPLVAGLAALCWAVNPDAQVDDVVAAIESTADEVVDPTNDRRETSGSAGCINAGKMINEIGGAGIVRDSSAVYRGESMQLTARYTKSSVPDSSWTWTVEPQTGDASIDSNGVITGVKAGTVKVIATATVDGATIEGKALIKINEIVMPSDPTATTDHTDEVVLSWEQAPAAKGYKIMRAEMSSSTYEEIGSVDGGDVTTYTDTTATPGKAYFYRVVPTSTLGTTQIEGEPSNSVMGTCKTAINNLASQSESADALLMRNYLAGTSVENLVVVGQDDIEEALTGTGLAGVLDAMVVVAGQDGLDSASEQAISGVNPTNVYVVGDTNAVSEDVCTQIQTLAPDATITRYNGASGTELGEVIYDAQASYWGDTCIVMPDSGTLSGSLAASSFAYSAKAPVLITNSKGALSSKSRQIVRNGGFSRVMIFGDTDTVSSDVETQLVNAGISSDMIVRYTQTDPYLLSAQLASDGIADGAFVDSGFYVCDYDYTAALEAASIAGYDKMPVVFVAPGEEEGLVTALSDITTGKLTTVTYVDGGSALSTDEKNRVSKIVGLLEPALDSISDATIAEIPDQVYTGEAIEPTVEVTLDGEALTKDVDYTVGYSNNVEVGEATVSIVGLGDYAGLATGSFNIVSADVTSLQEAIDAANSDKSSTPVSVDGSGLDKGTQYVSPTTSSAFSIAIAAAQSVLQETPLTEAEVAAAIETLNNAVSDFDAAKQTASGVFPTGVELDKTSMVMTMGKTSKLNATVTPTDAADVDLTWSSERPSIVQVDENGELAAITPGSTTITVQTPSGINATCRVTVLKNQSWTRLSGSDRYSTMAQIVSTGFDQIGGTVVLVSGENFPDALTASALAGLEAAPIVTTTAEELSPEAEAQIDRLLPSKVIIVGGKSAVSSNVESQVKSLKSSPEVTRLSGSNRQLTGMAVYEALGDEAGDVAIVASGSNFADSLSISPYAYAAKAPLFVTDSDGNLTQEQTEAIENGGFEQVLVLGGEKAVSSQVETDLSSIGCTRLAGADRYATSVAVASWEIAQGMTCDEMAVASGANYPDALAGGPLCGENNSIMLLTSSSSTDKASELLSENSGSISTGYILGGTGAVSDGTAAKIEEMAK